ncbi:MAG: hypothetical protein ABI175_21835 [Polyangiales bacterium]
MFNTTRWHRLLTVPALLVAIAALFFSPHPLSALAICPVMVALPWQLHAAYRGDPDAVVTALTATRVIGYLGIAWGTVILLIVPPAGLIMLGAFAGMLVAGDTRGAEDRLAIVMMIEGLLIGFSGVPLMWLGAGYFLLIPTGFVLFVGATWWLAEAARNPVTATDAAELPIAITV